MWIWKRKLDGVDSKSLDSLKGTVGVGSPSLQPTVPLVVQDLQQQVRTLREEGENLGNRISGMQLSIDANRNAITRISKHEMRPAGTPRHPSHHSQKKIDKGPWEKTLIFGASPERSIPPSLRADFFDMSAQKSIELMNRGEPTKTEPHGMSAQYSLPGVTPSFRPPPHDTPVITSPRNRHQLENYGNVYNDSRRENMYVKNHDVYAHLKSDRVYSGDVHDHRVHKSVTGSTNDSHAIQIKSSLEEVSDREFRDHQSHDGRPPRGRDGEWRHCRGLDLRYFDWTTGSFDAFAPLEMCLGDGDKFPKVKPSGILRAFAFDEVAPEVPPDDEWSGMLGPGVHGALATPMLDDHTIKAVQAASTLEEWNGSGETALPWLEQFQQWLKDWGCTVGDVVRRLVLVSKLTANRRGIYNRMILRRGLNFDRTFTIARGEVVRAANPDVIKETWEQLRPASNNPTAQEFCDFFAEFLVWGARVREGVTQDAAKSLLMHVLGTLKSDTLWWKVIEEEGIYNRQMNYLEVFCFVAPKLVTYERAARKKAQLQRRMQGKYKHATKVQGQKGRCRIAKEDNFINWTPEMRANFEKIKQAICTTCELYIPSPEGEYAIHVDTCTYGIGAVLEQKTPDGEWVPCAFFSRKLEGKPGQGQRGWSVREQETYAMVSCLLKFKSWISGRKVTIFSDHKSLESWYKEDLCTVSGPLGRRGRWHEFLSRYNIVVVYKPGPDNQVADGLSRWAYPAGLAEDSTFHGSESDLEGVQRQERELLEREEQFLAHQSESEPRAFFFTGCAPVQD